MEHRSQSFQAAYGSFLVIPLKYDPDTLDRARLERAAPCVPMTTMDLNENIKAMLDPASGSSVGTCYAVSRSFLTTEARCGRPLLFSGHGLRAVFRFFGE